MDQQKDLSVQLNSTAAAARAVQLRNQAIIQKSLDQLVTESPLNPKTGQLQIPEAIIGRDRNELTNKHSREWIQNRQMEIRKLRWRLQWEEIKYNSQFGSPEQLARLLPLVRRWEHPETWPMYGKALPDGQLFTFRPIEMLSYKVSECSLGICENEAECSHVIEMEEISEVFQTKHSVGNWECRGCLLSGDQKTQSQQQQFIQEVSGEVPATRQITWCPKFLAGLAMAVSDPMTYMAVVRKSNPDMKICYAGLMHSECEAKEKEFVFRFKCDTCGHYTEDVKRMEYQPTKEGDVLTTFENAVEGKISIASEMKIVDGERK